MAADRRAPLRLLIALLTRIESIDAGEEPICSGCDGIGCRRPDYLDYDLNTARGREEMPFAIATLAL